MCRLLFVLFYLILFISCERSTNPNSTTKIGSDNTASSVPADDNQVEMPEDTQTQILIDAKTAMKKVAIDEDSLKFRNETVRLFSQQEPILYAVCIEVNAKNRLGGYTGFNPYTIFYSEDGEVVKVWEKGFNKSIIEDERRSLEAVVEIFSSAGDEVTALRRKAIDELNSSYFSAMELIAEKYDCP